MISLVPPEIEQYAVDHTSSLPVHLEELTRFTYENTNLPQMLSGPIEGTLLQFLTWMTNARRILEIGTFTGFSAQMMSAVLPDDGVLITCEVDPEVAQVAQSFFNKSEHGYKIQMRLGPALETLESLEGPFDIIFIDADKAEYSNYYEVALGLLANRGIIVVDNVLWGGRVLSPNDDEARAIAGLNKQIRKDKRVRHLLLPIRDGVMLVHKA
jgi:caffeoyl-CoA O-methyltransferase|tara:strand:- start:562 stop:1197 length:636 start_codon:yes stop_codon:yes gene_type:complete